MSSRILILVVAALVLAVGFAGTSTDPCDENPYQSGWRPCNTWPLCSCPEGSKLNLWCLSNNPDALDAQDAYRDGCNFHYNQAEAAYDAACAALASGEINQDAWNVRTRNIAGDLQLAMNNERSLYCATITATCCVDQQGGE